MISKLVFVSGVICLTVSLWTYLGNHCCDNPVLKQNISEIIRSWPGFTAEEYYVITDDGYKLLVERSYSKITQESPIIIAHGVAMNAFGWVNRGNVSLARLLGDLGYDVWMLNFRGSCYSRGHIELNTTDRDYWRFNLNEVGIHDLRSTVKLVNEKTNRLSIHLGYSMGSISFLIYSSTFPEEAKEYVKGSILMAPIINYDDSRSFLRFAKYWWPYMEWFVNFLWNGEIFPGYSVVLRPLVTNSAGIYGLQYFINIVGGDDYEQIDILNFPLAITQMLDSIAGDLFKHNIQIQASGIFQKYDYGREKNMEIYGTFYPPPYNLSKIQVPMSVFYGANDWLATPRNSKQVYSEVSPSSRCGCHVVPFEKWNHLDFVIAKDLPKYLYKYIFNKIKEIDSGKCAP